MEVSVNAVPRNPTVLVVDDDPAILRLLKIYLGRADLEVTTATRATDALKMFAAGRVFDCVITDAILPDVTGFDLVRALRAQEQERRVPILMLTRKAERESIQQAAQAGVDDYLLKPVDESVLLDKVNQNLGRHHHPKQTHSLAMSGTPEASCSLQFAAELISLSETDLWIRIPGVEVGPRTPNVQLHIPILERIGLDLPRLRLQSSRMSEDGQALELHYGWFGLSEAQLQKLRAFIQREQIRRRN